MNADGQILSPVIHMYPWTYYCQPNRYEEPRNIADLAIFWLTVKPSHIVCTCEVKELADEYTAAWWNGDEFRAVYVTVSSEYEHRIEALKVFEVLHSQYIVTEVNYDGVQYRAWVRCDV